MIAFLGICQTTACRFRRAVKQGLAGLILAIMTCALLCLPPAGNAAPPVISQAQLKAVYLYNFFHFVNWPLNQESAEQTKSHFTIGVLGNSSLKEALTGLQKSLIQANKTPITTKFYDTFVPGMDLNASQILFICNSEEKNFEAIINQLKNKPILSVAESDDFFAKGGMILFREKNGNIRYKINREAVEKTGLRLKSQLLKSSL